jgi:hypothetical protein
MPGGIGPAPALRLGGACDFAAVRGKNFDGHGVSLYLTFFCLASAMKPFCLSSYAAAIAKITNTTNEKNARPHAQVIFSALA